MLRVFAGLSLTKPVPDEATVLNFRHLLEANAPAPSSTRNTAGGRDPEPDQAKKGNPWYFGRKAHIGVDAESGLVHTVTKSPARTGERSIKQPWSNAIRSSLMVLDSK